MKTIRTMMILDMKQRVLLTIILLMLFCSYSMGQTQRGYAVYTEEDQTITCYNDGLMDKGADLHTKRAESQILITIN